MTQHMSLPMNQYRKYILEHLICEKSKTKIVVPIRYTKYIVPAWILIVTKHYCEFLIPKNHCHCRVVKGADLKFLNLPQLKVCEYELSYQLPTTALSLGHLAMRVYHSYFPEIIDTIKWLK